MRFDKSASRQRGFTLMEVIVAVSILAVMTTLVASEFRSGLRASLAIRQKEDQINQRDTVMSVLEQQLRGALPMVYWTGGGSGRRSQLSLDGDARSIRFVSRTSFLDGPVSVPRWVELKWEQTGALNVTERRILSPDNAPDARIYWTGKIFETAKLRFEYLRRSSSTRPAVWSDSWNMSEQRELPAAVRMTYLSEKKDMVFTAPLEAAPTSWKGLFLK